MSPPPADPKHLAELLDEVIARMPRKVQRSIYGEGSGRGWKSISLAHVEVDGNHMLVWGANSNWSAEPLAREFERIGAMRCDGTGIIVRGPDALRGGSAHGEQIITETLGSPDGKVHALACSRDICDFCANRLADEGVTQGRAMERVNGVWRLADIDSAVNKFSESLGGASEKSAPPPRVRVVVDEPEPPKVRVVVDESATAERVSVDPATESEAIPLNLEEPRGVPRAQGSSEPVFTPANLLQAAVTLAIAAAARKEMIDHGMDPSLASLHVTANIIGPELAATIPVVGQADAIVTLGFQYTSPSVAEVIMPHTLAAGVTGVLDYSIDMSAALSSGSFERVNSVLNNVDRGAYGDIVRGIADSVDVVGRATERVLSQLDQDGVLQHEELVRAVQRGWDESTLKPDGPGQTDSKLRIRGTDKDPEALPRSGIIVGGNKSHLDGTRKHDSARFSDNSPRSPFAADVERWAAALPGDADRLRSLGALEGDESRPRESPSITVLPPTSQVPISPLSNTDTSPDNYPLGQQVLVPDAQTPVIPDAAKAVPRGTAVEGRREAFELTHSPASIGHDGQLNLVAPYQAELENEGSDINIARSSVDPSNSEAKSGAQASANIASASSTHVAKSVVLEQRVDGMQFASKSTGGIEDGHQSPVAEGVPASGVSSPGEKVQLMANYLDQSLTGAPPLLVDATAVQNGGRQSFSSPSGSPIAQPVQIYYTLRDLEPRDPMTDSRLHPPMVEHNQISGTPGNLTYVDPDSGKLHRCEIVTEIQRFGDGTSVTKWYDHDRPNGNSEVRDAQGRVTDAHRVDHWMDKGGDTLTRTTDVHNGATRTTEDERYLNGDVRHTETNVSNADGGGYRDTTIHHRDGRVDHTVEHFKPDDHTWTIYHEHTDPSGHVQRSHYIDYGGTDASAGASEGTTSSQANEATKLISALNDGRVDHQQLSTVIPDLLSAGSDNVVAHQPHIDNHNNLVHLDGSTYGNLHPDTSGAGHQNSFIDPHHPGGGTHPSDGVGHANAVPVHQLGDQAAVVPVHDAQDQRHPHADGDPAHRATPTHHSHDGGNASIVVPALQTDSPQGHKMVVDHSVQIPDTTGKVLPDSMQSFGAPGHSSAYPNSTHQMQPDDKVASASSSMYKGIPDSVTHQINWFDHGPGVHPTLDGQGLHQQHQTSSDAGDSSFNAYDQFVNKVQSSAHPSDGSDKSHASNKPHPDDGSNSNLTFAYHQDVHHDGGGHDDGGYA